MEKIKGVNLGGWFVLESWMKPALFHNINSKDETGFMKLNQHAKADLITHYETFITKDDFIYLKNLGINSLRLPVPWWFLGDDIYQSSVKYIHSAYKWADELDLNILVDLHTAPGCQNGFDNGGIEGVMTWHLDQKNIDLTIDKLELIVKEFNHYQSFYGIELLNEPFKTIDLNIIQTFYLRSYQRLRRLTDKVICFHDAFRPSDPSWENFFIKNNMENILFDIHLYHCFDPKLIHGTFDLHIDRIISERIPLILELEKFIKVVVGEWSLGINYDLLTKDNTFDINLYDKILANLQLYAYTKGYGYYFWNYKIERETHQNWDFRRLVEKGIMPNKY